MQNIGAHIQRTDNTKNQSCTQNAFSRYVLYIETTNH